MLSSSYRYNLLIREPKKRVFFDSGNSFFARRANGADWKVCGSWWSYHCQHNQCEPALMVSQLTCRSTFLCIFIYHRLTTDNHNRNRSKPIITWNLERHGTGHGIHDEIPRAFFLFFPVFNISRTTVGPGKCCLLHYDVNRGVRYPVYPDVTQSFLSLAFV